ncbi:MAG TPA: glycosyltransferase family 4 protein [Gemmatimonadales bacterium]|nr:glycosyltransferase family 4 protein [Gemmatimonadales bacterium]
MRALVIAPQPFFSPRGTPLSVYYRTLVTSQLGVRVDLLTYGAGEDVDIPGVRIIRIPRFRFLEPIEVGPSMAKLFLDGFVVLWTVGLLVRHRYDFVHAHEESVFFSRMLKPLFGFKLVYDMHSSLPQQLVNFRFTSSRALIRLFKRLEDSCLRRSDAVITICPDLAAYALPRLPDPRRHFLIENSIIEEVRLRNGDGRPATTSAAGPADPAPEPLPPDRPLVVYAGTFEPYQGIDLLLEAFARARERVPAAFLLLAGGRPDQVERYQRRARELGLEGHCRFAGQVPQALAREYVRRAAVVVSPRTGGTNTPLKVYEQLASGIPLVATRVHSHTQVLDDSVCFLADPVPEAFARGIVAALTDPARAARLAAAARELYHRRYSRPAYEGKMRELLEALR